MKKLVILAVVLALSFVSCEKEEISDQTYDTESTDKGELEEEDITPPN
ncbi:hypothetical protein [Aquimarina algiphila]|nr:hypothetical protein [Aquimarina algiphila]